MGGVEASDLQRLHDAGGAEGRRRGSEVAEAEVVLTRMNVDYPRGVGDHTGRHGGFFFRSCATQAWTGIGVEKEEMN